MRLTVHLSEVEKQKTEVPVKGKPGAFMMKETIQNTLSFTEVNPQQVGIILSEIESTGAKIASHYLSGDARYGRASGKKK
jgi:hypothetical protein